MRVRGGKAERDRWLEDPGDEADPHIEVLEREDIERLAAEQEEEDDGARSQVSDGVLHLHAARDS